MASILSQARDRFPVGTFFYSACEYSLPCVVNVPVFWSEHSDTIKSGGMGVIYNARNKEWATIITNENEKY